MHLPENKDESNQPQTSDNPNEVTGVHNGALVRGLFLSTAKNLLITKTEASGLTAKIVMLPLFGFFAGIYLVAKKQTGHGVACMALSVFAGLIFFVMMANG